MMASEMGCKAALAVILYLLGEATANVELTGVWKPNFGWEVSCSWKTLINDTLQSVRLFRNGQQYEVFRPEKNGMKLVSNEASPEFRMHIECVIGTPEGQRGRCLTSVELLARPAGAATDLYKCEVSGERPTFRLELKEFEALVPPTNATVTRTFSSGPSGREALNCSSSGIPPPKLVWAVDGREIPEDFTRTAWSYETKLWHSWSTWTPQSDTPVVATCTPEVVGRDRQLVTGVSYTVNAATDSRCYGITKILAACLILVALRK